MIRIYRRSLSVHSGWWLNSDRLSSLLEIIRRGVLVRVVSRRESYIFESLNPRPYLDLKKKKLVLLNNFETSLMT